MLPLAIYALTSSVALQQLPMPAQIALTLAIVVPLGPFVYRLVYQPIAKETTPLLIVSVAVHFAMVGFGLVMFGAKGSRTTPFSDAALALGHASVSMQSLWVTGAALYLYFEHTLLGKALRDGAQPCRRASRWHWRGPSWAAGLHRSPRRSARCRACLSDRWRRFITIRVF